MNRPSFSCDTFTLLSLDVLIDVSGDTVDPLVKNHALEFRNMEMSAELGSDKLPNTTNFSYIGHCSSQVFTLCVPKFSLKVSPLSTTMSTCMIHYSQFRKYGMIFYVMCLLFYFRGKMFP